jgi:hypothetical protein
VNKTIFAVALAAVAGLTGMTTRMQAATGDIVAFNLAHSNGAVCLPATSRARVTLSDQGTVQKMHIDALGLPANTTFTTFITQHAIRPFGVAWYQGEMRTDSRGRGVADFAGIFNDETFVLADVPVAMAHIGIWFADPADAVKGGCSGTVTPFDGDHEAGIQVFNSSNFADDNGPLLQLK